MAAEENGHRRQLIDLFVARFGAHIPLIRRQDIRGYIPQRPIWQVRPLNLEAVRACAHDMEKAAARFYRQAITRATDASVRKLLGDLAEIEDKHDNRVAVLERELLTDTARHAEGEHERRRFILQIIQPGLVGLMDGSVSTLAPVFAAAFATQIPGTPSSSVSRPRSGRASRWALRKRWRTTASSRAAARRSCAVSSAG